MSERGSFWCGGNGFAGLAWREGFIDFLATTTLDHPMRIRKRYGTQDDLRKKLIDETGEVVGKEGEHLALQGGDGLVVRCSALSNGVCQARWAIVSSMGLHMGDFINGGQEELVRCPFAGEGVTRR